MKLERLKLLVILGLLFTFAAACSAAPETYYFLVFSNPVAGHEDEYNKWYDTQHAQDVVAIPGFQTAQRFVKTELPLYRMVDLHRPFRPEIRGVGGEPEGAKPGPKQLDYQVVFTAMVEGKEDE